MLFSSKRRLRPGPKGPEKELIDAVVEMKRRNPTWGCPSTNCPADHPSLPLRPRQGCRTADPRNALPAGLRFRWSILAHIPGPREGQFVERRPISLRIPRSTNALGDGRDGPIYPTHRRVWHSSRDCRWTGIMSVVPRSDSTAKIADVSQHRQRSAVSVSSMAGQPSSIGSNGDQNSALCADISSFCRAAHWNHPKRMPGSDVVLDDRGSGAEATRFSRLL